MNGSLGLLLSRYPIPELTWAANPGIASSVDVLRDRYRGCLLWGAVGDALGRAAEGLDPQTLRDRYGHEGLRHYVPWRGWGSGATGSITDDTQLTMELARSLLATDGTLDPEDFARRLVDWLPTGRGKGQATTLAVSALARGEPWWQAGQAVNSAGNGAAMRAAPIGLARALQAGPRSLIRDALISALPTHAHPVGVAGAVVIAAGVAWCVRHVASGAREIEPATFLEFSSAVIEGMEPEPTPQRRPGGPAIRLSERVRELMGLVQRETPEAAIAYLYNGAFALESVPAALYCFLRSPDDPRQVILTAVNAGYDADTVASMAGNLVGAWCGARRLEREEPEWWTDLEYRDELIALGDGLLGLALRDASQAATIPLPE